MRDGSIKGSYKLQGAFAREVQGKTGSEDLGLGFGDLVSGFKGQDARGGWAGVWLDCHVGCASSQ